MNSGKSWNVSISIWRWIKAAFLVRPLAEYFREMPDPRCARKHKHSHVEILLLIVLGFLAGKASLRRIVKWARRNQEKLKKYLALENGIPSLSTFSRTACGIDEELLSMAFTDWIGNILSTKGIHIVIDGKALRAATEKIKDKKAPYILNAMDAATNLVIAQVPIPEKTNEMTAIPKLLEILDITGSTVTIDAIGATETILRMIDEKSGYFVQQIKKNCPATYQEIQNIFGQLEEEKEADPEKFAMKNKGCYSEYSSCEKNRERVEHREVKCYTNDEAVGKIREELSFIRSVASSCQVRIPKEIDADGNDVTPDKETFLKQGSRKCPKPTEGDGLTDQIQKVGLVSNDVLMAEEFARYKREHWRIENCLHHVLDEDFLEDKCTARKSKNILSVLRKTAYNIIRLMQMDQPKDREMVIDVIDEIADDFSIAIKWIFDPIPSFY